MSKKFLFTAIVMASSLLFTSCDKENPDEIIEEEVITTLNYTLTPTGGGTAVTLSFVDLDGDGGNEPTITGGTLAANTSYTAALELLNESEDPAEDITEEIEEEDEEHQFFFSTDISDLTIAYNDADADGNPIGLSSTVTTGDATTGSMTIILRHEPNKSAEGVSAGEIANAGGSTDIETTFSVEVQ